MGGHWCCTGQRSTHHPLIEAGASCQTHWEPPPTISSSPPLHLTRLGRLRQAGMDGAMIHPSCSWHLITSLQLHGPRVACARPAPLPRVFARGLLACSHSTPCSPLGTSVDGRFGGAAPVRPSSRVERGWRHGLPSTSPIHPHQRLTLSGTPPPPPPPTGKSTLHGGHTRRVPRPTT